MTSCAIPYCEHEDEETAKLVPVCGQGHMMHLPCVRDYVAKAKNELVCPLCRDPYLSQLRSIFVSTPRPSPEEEEDDDEMQHNIFSLSFAGLPVFSASVRTRRGINPIAFGDDF